MDDDIETDDEQLRFAARFVHKELINGVKIYKKDTNCVRNIHLCKIIN